MKQIYLKFSMLLLCLVVGLSAWGETKTGSWDLTSSSSDWTTSGNETYFSQPYGYKKANGTLTNKSIPDFSTNGITQIKVGFKCLQNSGTTSKLTIYLVDKDGKTLGNGVVVTPDNISAASQTTYKYATFTTNLTGATGFMMKVTTFGKNILINGAEYEVIYTPSGETPSTPTSYTVSLAKDLVGGSISANPTSATEGTEVILSATPNDGYEFSSWYVLDGDANEITVTDNKFTMPASDVEVSATFVKGNYVTLDFTSNDVWRFPIGSTNKLTNENSYSNNGYEIKLKGSSGEGYYYVNTGGYLLLGKEGASLTLPVFAFDVKKIAVVGTGTASKNVKQNIYVGETSVSTETTGYTGETFVNVYEINEDYQKAGNTYILKVLSANNTQITQIKVYAKEGSEIPENPTVDPDPVEHTITWSVNGNTTSSTIAEGASITFSTPTENIPEGKEFVGWSESAITGTTDTAPTFVTSATMGRNDKTYYAVFATKESGSVWKKVAAKDVNSGGVYAIITADGHAFNGSISSGHGQVTSTTFNFDSKDEAISAPNGTCELEFKVVTSGYQMYNADKGYLYATAASSGKLAWDNSSAPKTYWCYGGSTNNNWIYSGNNAYLRDYSNISIRTYGANNGSVIQFAKKESGDVYTGYCTSIATENPDEPIDPTPTTVFYELVTNQEELVDGEYIIAIKDGETYRAMTSTIDSDNYLTATTVSVTDNKISDPNGAATWTAKVSTTSYGYPAVTLKNGDYYLAYNDIMFYSANPYNFVYYINSTLYATVDLQKWFSYAEGFNVTSNDDNSPVVYFFKKVEDTEPKFTKQTLSLKAQDEDGYWTTFCSDKVTFFPNDVTVNTVVVENGIVNLFAGEDGVFKEDIVEISQDVIDGYYVPANTGILVNSNETSAIYYEVENKIVEDVDTDFNMLRPASVAMETDGSYKFYKLSYKSSALDALGFYYGYQGGAAFSMTNPNGAYLAVPSSSAGNIKAFVLTEGSTGINAVSTMVDANAPIYNVAGQRVSSATKGLYIQNGKKFFVK